MQFDYLNLLRFSLRFKAHKWQLFIHLNLEIKSSEHIWVNPVKLAQLNWYKHRNISCLILFLLIFYLQRISDRKKASKIEKI